MIAAPSADVAGAPDPAADEPLAAPPAAEPLPAAPIDEPSPPPADEPPDTDAEWMPPPGSEGEDLIAPRAAEGDAPHPA